MHYLSFDLISIIVKTMLNISISESTIIVIATRGDKLEISSSTNKNNEVDNKKPTTIMAVRLIAKIRFFIKYLNTLFMNFLTLQIAHL